MLVSLTRSSADLRRHCLRRASANCICIWYRCNLQCTATPGFASSTCSDLTHTSCRLLLLAAAARRHRSLHQSLAPARLPFHPGIHLLFPLPNITISKAQSISSHPIPSLSAILVVLFLSPPSLILFPFSPSALSPPNPLATSSSTLHPTGIRRTSPFLSYPPPSLRLAVPRSSH